MIDIELKPYPGEDEITFTKRKAYFIRIVKPRMNYGNTAIEKKLVSAVSLSHTERDEIDAFWSQYMSPRAQNQLLDYRYYEVFKSALIDGEKLCRYMPDSFFYLFVDDYYTNPQHSNPSDDKNLYDLFFHDINRPRTVFRKIGQSIQDERYNEITLETAIRKVRDCGEVILKIAKFSYGGKGILFWNPEKDKEDDLLSFLRTNAFVVCQEVVKQHPVMEELNSNSVNTIRYMTFAFKGKIHILSSAIRFGINGLRTDNINSGGLACGLDPDGRVKKIGFDVSARQYTCHPNGKSFDEFVIPGYQEAVDMVIALARRVLTVSKLISWDIAIDEAGKPLLIETNLTGSGLNFHQICNGPILGDLTEEVLKDVFENSYTLKSIIKSIN